LNNTEEPSEDPGKRRTTPKQRQLSTERTKGRTGTDSSRCHRAVKNGDMAGKPGADVPTDQAFSRKTGGPGEPKRKCEDSLVAQKDRTRRRPGRDSRVSRKTP